MPATKPINHEELAMDSAFQSSLENIISQQSALRQQDERAVELFVVIPILKHLGWDTSNPSEIYPQHGLSEGGKVDYDLQIEGESRILIEVKRWAHTLAVEDETQLLNYCQSAKPRPKLGVLTNGWNWKLYLSPTAKTGPNSVLKMFSEVDIMDMEPDEIESAFRQFLRRDSMADFKATLNEAKGLHLILQNEHEQRRLLIEAWSELSGDNNKLAKLILELAEIESITTNLDNVIKFIESVPHSLVNEITVQPPPPGKPASFDLPNSPTHKTKVSYKIGRPNGWNNCRIEICELMLERHPPNFRGNLLSMPDLFTEIGDDPKRLISDSGIYIRPIWTSRPASRAACYAVITKFGYPQDSLVIRNSKGNPF